VVEKAAHKGKREAPSQGLPLVSTHFQGTQEQCPVLSAILAAGGHTCQGLFVPSCVTPFVTGCVPSSPRFPRS
jgi:hypothetical protein